MKRTCTLSLFFLVLVTGCASTYESTSTVPSTNMTEQTDVQFSPYSGEKTRVAVFPIAMTQKALNDFPEYTAELRQQSVGYSLWNTITETLYDTKRFTFVEISEEIVKKIVDQWYLGASGMADPGAALQMGKLKQAENFIYGEITEFGVENTEKVSALSSKTAVTYRIGVHLRFVNGETLEYIPATGIGKGPTITEASAAAIRSAVAKLLQRMD